MKNLDRIKKSGQRSRQNHLRGRIATCVKAIPESSYEVGEIKEETYCKVSNDSGKLKISMVRPHEAGTRVITASLSSSILGSSGRVKIEDRVGDLNPSGTTLDLVETTESLAVFEGPIRGLSTSELSSLLHAVNWAAKNRVDQPVAVSQFEN